LIYKTKVAIRVTRLSTDFAGMTPAPSQNSANLTFVLVYV